MQSKDKKLLAVPFSALLILASGCGILQTKNKGQKSRENDSALSGKWENACSKLDWLGFSYHRTSLSFSSLGDFDKTTNLYSDDNCTAATATLTEHGTYSSLGDAQAGSGSQNINYTISEASVTAVSDSAVRLFNAVSYCGISSWQVGQATDVLDKPCAGAQHAKGAVIFDIYKVDNNGDRLTTGKGSFFLDKSDASSRPSKLDEVYVFTKK
jgi:hypothetical protein